MSGVEEGRVVEMVMVEENVVEERTDTSLADTSGADVRAAKRIALGHATALAGLTLQVVMQFAGKNEGIFVANVCKSWKTSHKSTFDGQIRTHRTAGMMSLQRVKWLWPKARPGKDRSRPQYWCGGKHLAWCLGKYAPRLVVEGAILDETISVDSETLMKGVAASGRMRLIENLWEDHVTARTRPSRGLGQIIASLGPEASRYGHLRVLAYVWCRLGDTDKLSCGKACASAAATGGHIHVLEFLSLTEWWSGEDGPEHFLGSRAAGNDHINVLRWLPAHGHAWADHVALAAGASGEVSTIVFLLDNECPGFDQDFVACCAQYNRLDALQWCYDTLRMRVPEIWTEENLQEWLLLAGNHEQKGSAKFLLERGALWPNIGQRFGEEIDYHISLADGSIVDSADTCFWSPSFLEWAMTEGCTLDTWTTTTCARLTMTADMDEPSDCPILETISWAHKKGCPCACLRDEPDF